VSVGDHRQVKSEKAGGERIGVSNGVISSLTPRYFCGNKASMLILQTRFNAE